MFSTRSSSVFAALIFVTTIAALGCEGCCGSVDQSDGGTPSQTDAANDSPMVEPDAGPTSDATPGPDAQPAPDAGHDANDAEPATDAGVDAQPSVDAAPDAMDSGTDSSDAADTGTGVTDSGSDAIADASVDAQPDASTDAAPDAASVPDAGQDSGFDAGPLPDAGSDAGQDAGPQAFGCDTWTRNASFDALRFNGATIDGVGHMTGTSASDIYVPVGSAGAGTVAHWNGSAFALESVPGQPIAAYAAMCASSSTDVWLASYDQATSAGYLARRQGGAWALDTTAPAATGFGTIWCAGVGSVFLGGSTVSGTAGIWMRTAASGTWTAQVLPTIVGWNLFSVGNVWGSDATHMFATVTGLDASGTVLKGFVLAYNGSSWTDLQAPAELYASVWVQGSSASDLFLLGTKSDSTTVLYHGTGRAGEWQSVPWTSPPFSDTLIAPALGAAIVGSQTSTSTAGSGRLDIVQLDTQLRTVSIDAQAFLPTSFWQAPGTDTFFFDHMSVLGTVAGFYTGTCH